MSQPLVSVLIPTYNHVKYIRQSIDSVLNQTYKNIEIIVSDNGSTDGTAEIIRTYSEDRIHANFFSENTGFLNNSLYVFSKAKGKYVAHFSSDDYWDLTKIEKQVAMLEKNKELGAVFTHAEVINDDGGLEGLDEHPLKRLFVSENRTQAEWLRRFFIGGNCLCCPSVLIHTDIQSQLNNSMSHGFRQLGDFNFWVQLVKSYPIYIIQEKLTYHRVRNDNGNLSAGTTGNALRHMNEVMMIYREFFDNIPEDLFIEAFGNDFYKKGNLSSKELLCEQAFLYFMHSSDYISGRMMAWEKLYMLLKDPECRDILVRVYGFSLEDYYELSSSFMCVNINTTQ